MKSDAFLIPLTAALATLVAGALLVRVAPRLGWGDGPGPAGGRKHQRRSVPTVGGASLLLGLVVGWLLFDAAGRLPEALTPGRGLGRLVAPALGSAATLFPLGACVVAFLVGLIDDLRPGGLSPRAKLLGQGLAGAVLGAPLLVSSSVPTSAAVAALLAFVLGAIVATNLINTFDNADGAATSVSLLGLAGGNPLLAAPLAGFLPLNLLRPRARGERPERLERLERDGRDGREHPTPRAYLGDSGSHLVGVLILATPAAWPVLLIPALDLARLSLLRVRSGAAPWDGDRRHLAHRLELRGLPRLAVPALLTLLAAPAVVGAWFGTGGLLAGALVTTGLFSWAVLATPDPGPCAVAREEADEGAPGGLLSGDR